MVLWGTSFSGGHVVQVASADRFLAAAVAQVPFVDGLASMRLMTPSHALRLSATAIADLAADRLGRSPRYVPIVGPPGSVAIITAAGAGAGYRALFPAGYPFRNEVAARVVLQVGRYRPVTVAGHVSCPLLMCVCDRDAVCPVEPAVRAAALAPAGELCRYDAEHFDIYFGELFERAMRDQIEFLRRHVPVAGTPAATAPRPAEEKAGEPLGEERAGIVGA